ncbi:MAG: metal ABC transporter permease [Acidobacteria bacterium]|nr:MAG: metal ABC transporter permease [Acidobacteriota bacterium]
MLDVLEFLAAPFTACAALVVILGYFGIHVILRRVIFVDLALAQIAALGTLLAFMRGHEPGSAAAIGYSLGAALAGAAIFSATRSRRERVPQEAIIGITYVVASALAIVVADRAPEGAEHIKELLAGAVIWVTWPAVLRDAAVFAAVGVLHVLLRRRFIEITDDPEGCFERGIAVRAWDFLFYAGFGVVITFAVGTGGVLMVFSFLVAPAILAIGLADGWGRRVAIAWAAGLAASAAGLLGSYRWDMPAGPAVVCVLGLLLVVHAAARAIPLPRARRPEAADGG